MKDIKGEIWECLSRDDCQAWYENTCPEWDNVRDDRILLFCTDYREPDDD